MVTLITDVGRILSTTSCADEYCQTENINVPSQKFPIS